MPDIVLKNILGQEVVYPGIDTVKLKNTAGGEETFSHGVAVEDVPIELDLANGETQTIVAPEGSLVKSAIVTVTGAGGGEPVLNMPETAITFTETLFYIVNVPMNVTELPFNYIIEGANYTVVWDGVEYQCKAWKYEESSATDALVMYAVGNTYFTTGEASAEPFIIGTVNGVMCAVSMTEIMTGGSFEVTHTASVTLNLEAGGGSGVVDHLMCENVYSEITEITQYKFSADKILETIDLPNVTKVNNYAFQNCSNLKTVHTPNLTTVGSSAFSGCSSLSEIDVSKVKSIGSSAFNEVPAILDFKTSINSRIGSSAFGGTITPPKAVVIRNTTMIPDAANANGYLFGSTRPKLLVPSALVSTWKSSYYMKSYHSSLVYALENYTVDGTIDGEIDISKL